MEFRKSVNGNTSRSRSEKRLAVGTEPGQVIMSVVGKQFKIEVESIDLGQILDGLRSRQESWKNTAIFLRDGFFPDDALVCEECSDPDEAEKIARHYERIIRSIEQQIDQQSGF